MDYVALAVAGANAVDFGDLIVNTYAGATASNGSRGIYGCGNIPPNSRVETAQYITFQQTGDALDFGELTQTRRQLAATSDGSRGVWMGGSQDPPNYDTIDYVNIGTLSDGRDFGNLSQSRMSNDAAFSGA